MAKKKAGKKTEKKVGEGIELPPIESLICLITAVAKANKQRVPLADLAYQLRCLRGEPSNPFGEPWLRRHLQLRFLRTVQTDDNQESDRRADLVGTTQVELPLADLKMLRLNVDNIKRFLRAPWQDLVFVGLLLIVMDEHDERGFDTKLPDAADEVLDRIFGFVGR